MKKILFAAVVAALFCSCAKDETTATPTNEGKLVYRELTADIAPMSRAFLGEPNDGKVGVFLEEGDLVLFVGTDASAILPVTERLKDGSVKFAGEMPEGELKAYYPFWAYDKAVRDYWDYPEEKSSYGTLHIDKHQFAKIPSNLDTYYANDTNGVQTEANLTDMQSLTAPVAMKNESIAADADSFTFTADTNAAILEIPVKGNVMLEKISLYYTDTNPDFKGRWNIEPNKMLNFVHTQLTDEIQNFYVMVEPGNRYITIEFQTSTPDEWTATQITNGILPDWLLGTSYVQSSTGWNGIRYMRRLSTKASTVVGGVTKLPTITVNTPNDPFIYHFGTQYQNNDILYTKNETKVSTIELGPNYAQINMGRTLKESDGYINYRGDAKFFNETGADKKPAISPGQYRYLAIKTDAHKVVKNETFWTKQKGQTKLNLVGGGMDAKTYYNTYDQVATRIECADGSQVLVYDLMGKFNNDGKTSYAPTTSTVTPWIEFVCADARVNLTTEDAATEFENAPTPSYKIYWIGFFNNEDSISQYAANAGKVVSQE